MTVGRGWRPSMPVSSDAVHVPGTTSQERSSAWSCPTVSQPASCAVCIAPGEQPGGDEHEDEPGELEEAREVQPHAAGVDAPADQAGDRDAEDGADAGGRRVGRALERGEHEHGGLEALADHGEERHPDQRDHRALGQRGRGARAQLAREAAGVAAHPHDHERDHRDGQQADDRLEALLLALGKIVVEDLENDGDARRRSSRPRRPRPTSSAGRRGGPPGPGTRR